MEPTNRHSKYSIKMSIESRQSVGSGCRSLERPSWTERQNSLTKKHSLIEVMSLQSGRRSDIFDKLLNINTPILGRQSMGGIVEQNNYYPYSNQNEGIKLTQRKSDEDNPTLNHTCKCYTECEWQTCPCSESLQLCIEGYCCTGCIQHKTTQLQINLPNLLCTCKKTKCNKKYCSCFAAGVLCGDKCTCEGCINCLRPPVQKMSIQKQEEDDIPQQQLRKMPMPQNMDFEPVEFRFSNNG